MRKLPVLLALLAALGLAAVPALAQGGCFPDATHLCLNGARFRVEVDWALPGGVAGKGQAVPLTSDTGAFWFFDNANLELVVKVLDGRAVNGHFWVFYGGLSDVARWYIGGLLKHAPAVLAFTNPTVNSFHRLAKPRVRAQIQWWIDELERESP